MMEEPKVTVTNDTDGGAGAPGGQGGDSGGKQAAPQVDELSAMRAQMTQMQKQLEEANARLSDPGYIEYLARKAMGQVDNGDGSKGGNQTNKQPQPQLPDDWDDLTPAQMLEVVKSAVAQEVLPQVGQVATALSQLEAKMEIERVAAKYDDFEDYVPTMTTLVQQNPYLSPEQAYLLAKNLDGSKPKDQKKDAEVVPLAQKIVQELRGSGAMPGGAVPTRETVRGKSTEQVASSIFDKIFGGSK